MSFIPLLFICIYLVLPSFILNPTGVASFCNSWNISLRAFRDLAFPNYVTTRLGKAFPRMQYAAGHQTAPSLRTRISYIHRHLSLRHHPIHHLLFFFMRKMRMISQSQRTELIFLVMAEFFETAFCSERYCVILSQTRPFGPTKLQHPKPLPGGQPPTTDRAPTFQHSLSVSTP